MKTIDHIKERSERRLSSSDFIGYYNEDLPARFPRASQEFLKEFKKTYPGLFKNGNTWSLDQHRKKFMDWLPQYIRSLS